MSADYQDTIANYLARKENIRYAMEVASSIDAAKAILRGHFWNALEGLCKEYFQEHGMEFELRRQLRKGDPTAVEELWICPKNQQAYSLCYAWQDEGNDVAFGLRFSRERYVDGRDLIAEKADIDSLQQKMLASLPKSRAKNLFWLCWKQELGTLHEASDLEKIAEDARNYAERFLASFQGIDTENKNEIFEINRSLASLKAP